MNTSVNKANVALLTAALSTILVWVLNKYAHADLPLEVQGAINAALSWLGVYIVPNKET